MKQEKSFTDGLGISNERVEQIGEMVMQTIMNGYMTAQEIGEKGGGYDALFENLMKLQREDIRLLKSIEEGIIYGYALNEAMDELRKMYIELYASAAANTLNDLINTLMSDTKKDKKNGGRNR